jgi:hypothetical protein
MEALHVDMVCDPREPRNFTTILRKSRNFTTVLRKSIVNSVLAGPVMYRPPPDGADCDLPSLTARSTRDYIARKPGNHYTGHHNCIIETVSDTPFMQTTIYGTTKNT